MSTYLVLGATGKTGSRVAARLVAAGHRVRGAARTPPPGGMRFDWDTPATYDPALDGADGIYLVPPARRLDHPPLVAAFSERARAHGIERMVVLSARGADRVPEGPLARMEAAVTDAGIAPTVVRPTWFMQDFTEDFLAPAIREAGVVVAPTGDGAEPFIDVEDIAAVVVEALTADGHAGRAYDLSGPRALTFAEAAAVLSDVTGRPIRHHDPGAESWLHEALATGVPPAYAELLGMLFGLVRDGHDAVLSDGVQRALGREPGSFEDWAAREAGVLRVAEPVAG